MKPHQVLAQTAEQSPHPFFISPHGGTRCYLQSLPACEKMERFCLDDGRRVCT